MLLLLVVGSPEADHREPQRIEKSVDGLRRPALAGCVHPLQADQHGAVAAIARLRPQLLVQLGGLLLEGEAGRSADSRSSGPCATTSGSMAARSKLGPAGTAPARCPGWLRSRPWDPSAPRRCPWSCPSCPCSPWPWPCSLAHCTPFLMSTARCWAMPSTVVAEHARQAPRPRRRSEEEVPPPVLHPAGGGPTVGRVPNKAIHRLTDK